MPDPLRVLVVANKSWECDPIAGVLSHRDARSPKLQPPQRGFDVLEPRNPDPAAPKFRGNPPARPRLVMRPTTTERLDAELWCVEDWMCTQRTIGPDGTQVIRPGSSSSYEKLEGSLPQIAAHAFGGAAPDLVIATGTAGIPAAETLNGCVTIGSRCYVHDPWSGAPPQEIALQIAKYGPMLDAQLAPFTGGVILSPRLSPSLFRSISAEMRFSAEARFLAVPIAPAHPPRILAGHGYAALSTVNINDYDDYIWADGETLRLFESAVRQREIGSMETTHALVRIAWPTTPFLFVSGLTDRVPLFNAEVTPRSYAQNFVAAHNAGVAIAHLLPELSRLHQSGELWAA